MYTDMPNDTFTHRNGNARDCHTRFIPMGRNDVPTCKFGECVPNLRDGNVRIWTRTQQAIGSLTGLSTRKTVRTHIFYPFPWKGTIFRLTSLERSIQNLRDRGVSICTLTCQAAGLLTGLATREAATCSLPAGRNEVPAC